MRKRFASAATFAVAIAMPTLACAFELPTGRDNSNYTPVPQQPAYSGGGGPGECTSIQAILNQEISPWTAVGQNPDVGICDQANAMLHILYWSKGAIKECQPDTAAAQLAQTDAEISQWSATYGSTCADPNIPVYPERPQTPGAGSAPTAPDNSNSTLPTNNGTSPGGTNGAVNGNGANTDGGGNGADNGNAGDNTNPGDNGATNGNGGNTNGDNANGDNGGGNTPDSGADPQLQHFANTVCAQGDPQSPDCANNVLPLATQSNFTAAQGTFSAITSSPNIQPLSQSQLPDSCGYFTRPLEDSHGINRYANDAFVCFQGEGYSCDDDRWVDKGVCLQRPDDPDADATHLEQSHFNTDVNEGD